jgi:hypothetical protein
MIGRTCGRSGSENAGMSSESAVRIRAVENLRFPGEGSSARGKSGPKPRPEGVGDGQQVEIPVLPIRVNREAGTQEEDPTGPQEGPAKDVRSSGGKSPEVRPKSEGEGKTSTEAEDSTLTRKAAAERMGTRTANRHRWEGRESRDEREKHCQGTRQIDPVSSREGVPARAGRSEKAQATVYQKHRSLRNRKMTYRG